MCSVLCFVVFAQGSHVYLFNVHLKRTIINRGSICNTGRLYHVVLLCYILLLIILIMWLYYLYATQYTA